jgi:AraC family transcriptional regulator
VVSSYLRTIPVSARSKAHGPGPVARCFGLADAPTLAAQIAPSSTIQMTRISCGSDRMGRMPETPRDDSFVVALYLTGVRQHEMWRGGRLALSQGYAPGTIRIVNLADGYSAHLYEPHETLCITLPRSALDGFADEARRPHIAGLACRPGALDPVINGLAEVLAPAFTQSADVDPLFVDHVGAALCAHLAHAYGGFQPATVSKGGLSPYQQRRAKELLERKLVARLSLPEIARECGLSVGYFARAFRVSTGTTPHQWLQRCRLEKAKSLLLESAMPIADIAAILGFADQSHLTRTFTRMAGQSPATWRRLNARRPSRN